MHNFKSLAMLKSMRSILALLLLTSPSLAAADSLHNDPIDNLFGNHVDATMSYLLEFAVRDFWGPAAVMYRRHKAGGILKAES